MDYQRYSTMNRLLRVTAYVQTFINNLKGANERDNSHTCALSSTEILVREAQTSLTEHSKFQCWKQQFNLFLDPSGVWRCGGRISYAELPYSAKHPILLPKDHHLTSLIVLRAHKRVLHDGVKETLTEIRSKYWIIRGSSTVKTILKGCVICRKSEGRPYLAPPPPPLPKFRVKEELPFTYTGVDFAGPLYVKKTETTAGGKVWLCLYTCCVVRAVHLDIVPDLWTSSFIRSFKRFSARRGLPLKMISDNGKTFKAAAKALERTMQNEEVQQHLSGVGVQWTFNIERAPWWGGIFERMMKRCLKKIIGKARLSYDELLTAVTEVEMIINSRPLTYISSEDMETPLTPSHLLTERRVLCLPDGLLYHDQIDEDSTLTHDCLTRRMWHLNVVLNQFWTRWKREYLLELRESHRYKLGHPEATPPAIGDIVLIHDDKPRGFWRLGRVKEVIVGRDGHIRGAVLRVSLGNGNTSILKRPIQLSYPLEVNCAILPRMLSIVETQNSAPVEEPVMGSREPTTSHAEDIDDRVLKRPTRASALQARDQIKAWSIQESDI